MFYPVCTENYRYLLLSLSPDATLLYYNGFSIIKDLK